MIAGPSLLIGLPLAMVPIVYLLRRWEKLAAFLSAVTTAAVAGLCLHLPLDRPSWIFGFVVDLGRTVRVLGREFALLETGRLTIAFVFGVATALFLFARWISQGRSFFPLGLLILGLLNCVILIRHLLFSVLFLATASIIAVFIVQGGRRGSAEGAFRYLMSTILAFPPLLVSIWLMEQYALNPDEVGLIHSAIAFLMVGFAIFLAVVPFHGWVPAIAAEAPPLVTALILTVMQAIVLLLMLNLLGSHLWLAENPRFFWTLRVVGLAMVVWGGFSSPFQRDFGHLWGYAALNDMGWVLASLGMTSPSGLSIALWQFASRTVAMVMGAMGLAVMRHRARGEAGFAQLRGAARRLPFSAAGLILSGLSLAGFPFTIGFPSRWAAFSLVASHVGNWLKLGAGWPLLLILADGGVAAGYLRGLNALLSSSPDPDLKPEPALTSIVILSTILLCFVLSIYPQPLLVCIRSAAESLAFPSP